VLLGSVGGHTVPKLLSSGPVGVGLGPLALVVRKGSVAFVWEYRSGGSLHSQLRLDGPGKQARVLDATSSPSGNNRELSPSFTAAGVLSWARRGPRGRSWMEVFGNPALGVHAYLLPSPVQALASLQLSREGALSGTILYGRGDDHGGSTIRRLAEPPASVSRR